MPSQERRNRRKEKEKRRIEEIGDSVATCGGGGKHGVCAASHVGATGGVVAGDMAEVELCVGCTPPSSHPAPSRDGVGAGCARRSCSYGGSGSSSGYHLCRSRWRTHVRDGGEHMVRLTPPRAEAETTKPSPLLPTARRRRMDRSMEARSIL
ncbi:hypothetical protein DAI22_07g269400 [Oryza sativa Japonica Group]|nr:hypothetical protein DAI22_07g269400 [Oryza sativa Japonica Group]